MGKPKKYPNSETLVLLKEPSETLLQVLNDLKVFGYHTLTVLLNNEEEKDLTEPRVFICELNPETLDKDASNNISELKKRYSEAIFVAVFTHPLKYSYGEVKKQGIDYIYHLYFDRELFINEIFEAAPIDIPTKLLNLDALVRVNIIELENEPLPFNLYIYLPSNKKTILYRP
ncbi:MAG: hypothetical protein H6625_14035 [Bdellovibrionaceae bacterium]|nr:hypothetical protein [Pseudobdellovibrionaceae bacterium]